MSVRFDVDFENYTLQGRVLVGSAITEVSLVIRNGVVAKACMGHTCREGKVARIEGSHVVLPGAIDMHVHLRGLKLSYKEDEETGTLAAAAGGITFVVDMPNTSPRINNVRVLGEKLASLRQRAYVDYGVYIGYTGNPMELDGMLREKRVLGLKLYPEDLQLIDERVTSILRSHKKVLVVHCEHPQYISENCRQGERSRCRPVLSEVKCVNEFLGVFKSVKTHITHATSSRLLLKAKAHGFTVDTCPHYVLLDRSYERRLGCIAKVNPPLRSQNVRDRLLKHLTSGVVDAWVTDHAPHSIAEKQQSFQDCPPGFPGLEVSLRLLYTLVNRGLLSLWDAVVLTNYNPRRILGLSRYGCFEPGCIASFTVVDLKREGVIDSSKFLSKAKYTPFEGFKYRGEPIATIVRGFFVYVDGYAPMKPRLTGDGID